ncbi:MAG: hypothetical protein HZA53_13930, partial [Planctomycetes bacterium]|nr:hypothetical protein [Planctomycetota bacterium]
MILREIVLKETPRRRVHLELEDERPVRVVKRIPAAGLAGLRARRLAKREFEVQRKLFALGLAVPEPLACTTTAAGVELVQRCVADARELADVLRAEDAPGRERLARDVGALLGRAHALGLDHPDLHEKNVLVDEAGKPGLIDFPGARTARSAGPERARRDLVQLAAAT